MIVSKQNLTGKLTDKQSIQGKINKATEYIEPITQEKTIVPTKQIQEVLPDENIDLLSKVIVNAIPNEYIIPQGEIEITENGITNVTQYASANINVSGTKVYPPNWSEIGYEDTPQSIIDDFNYSKSIYDNWDSEETSLNSKFASNTNLKYMPLINTSNVTNMNRTFASCTNLVLVPKFNTSKVETMYGLFSSCSNLENLDLSSFNTSNVVNMSYMFAFCSKLQNIQFGNHFTLEKCNYSTALRNMFNSCDKLSNKTLNDILKILPTAISYIGAKTLKYMGLSQEQANTCTTLSNYQAFLGAGWTTGY